MISIGRPLPEVDVNTRDRVGRTPLFLAAWEGHEAVAAVLLLNDNIDVNLAKGRTIRI